MPYPKTLNSRALSLLEPLLPRIEALEGGEGLTLETEDAGELSYVLATWRHLSNRKEEFRISKESPFRVRITRRVKAPKILGKIEARTVEEEALQTNAINFVHENLLDVLDEEVVEEECRKHLGLGEIKFALQEWRRINR